MTNPARSERTASSTVRRLPTLAGEGLASPGPDRRASAAIQQFGTRRTSSRGAVRPGALASRSPAQFKPSLASARQIEARRPSTVGAVDAPPAGAAIFLRLGRDFGVTSNE